jgi:uncharacterized protein
VDGASIVPAVTPWLYLVLALFLFLANLTSMGLNLFLLPGNWLVVIQSALFAALIRGANGAGISWGMIALLLVLAIAGEVVEFAAGAAGAARLGASRRGVVLSMVGAFVGTMTGLAMGIPIPIVGSVLAAIAGGALGAFGGAYLGEQWKGRSHEEGLAIGQGAMWGRLGGTAGKLAIGVVMVVLVTWDSFQ